MVAAELIVAAATIGLTSRFAAERTLDLVAVSIEARLDAVAEEVERRGAPLGMDMNLPEELLADLSLRFPDPMAIVAFDGTVRHVVHPNAQAFGSIVVDTLSAPQIPEWVLEVDAFDGLVVDASDASVPGGMAFAPLYDATGLPVGGLLVQPLSASVAREMEGPRQAARESLRVVMVLALFMALVLGGLVTWWFVAPLRRIADRVSEIGAGSYSARVGMTGGDEIGQLAEAVDRMAGDVEHSVTRLQAADRLRRELLANVGHDLRTPLAAVQAYIDEAGRFESEGRLDDAAEAVSGASRQLVRVRRLVDDLFELSILEGERPALRLEPVPMGELLADALAAIRPATPEGIALHRESSGALPTLEADGSRILRLVMNLLTNAVRHARTSVTLASGVSPDTVWFRVDDDGLGMAADNVERVFDRYYRGTDARTSSTESGTGLGLAIARAVADVHGGHINMSSRPGEGTSVQVDLPRPPNAS